MSSFALLMASTRSVDHRAYSKTELSFWSPQMRISAMDLSVSTKRLRLLSFTVWFFTITLCRYLVIKKVKTTIRTTDKVGELLKRPTNLSESSECGFLGLEPALPNHDRLRNISENINVCQ